MLTVVTSFTPQTIEPNDVLPATKLIAPPRAKRHRKSIIVRKKPLPEVLPISSLMKLLENLPNDEYKAFFAFAYLSGARVTEILMVEKRDIELIDPLDRGEVLVAHVYTEKHPQHPRRLVPLRLVSYLDRIDTREKEAELNFYKLVENYWDGAPDGLLFHYSRKTIWHYFKKLKQIIRATDGKGEVEIDFGIHPHYLRHCRATHLSPFLSDKEMRDFFGWKSTEMVNIYANTKGTDILLKFQR